MSAFKVLYVDDEIENLTSFRYLFKKDFETAVAQSGAEGIKILNNEKISIIISDQRMPEMSGVEFLEYAAEHFPDTVRILLTGYSDMSAVIAAVNKGKIYHYLSKPFDLQEMKITLKNAMELFNLRLQNRHLMENLIETNKELSALNNELEQKVREKTKDLESALEKVNSVRKSQDGDYYLTSLLIEPLVQTLIESSTVKIDTYINQKKKFAFKNLNSSIGGDLIIADRISLLNRSFAVFLNADAMGKSSQGAGGVIVFGTAFKLIMERVKDYKWGRNQMPEEWLYNTYQELNKIFLTFQGFMMISMFIGLLDEETGELFSVNADHPFPVLYRNGKAELILQESNCFKLGMIAAGDREFSVGTYRLKKGDRLIVGSDGKDDIILNSDKDNTDPINSDEFLFLKFAEQGKGDIHRIADIIGREAELIDDFSLISIDFL